MSLDFRKLDTRNYATYSVRDGYRRWAPIYDEGVYAGMDEDLLDRVEDVQWASIRSAADLACGTGRMARWLRARGAGAVDGVDLTPEMLDRARAGGAYRRLEEGDMCRTPFDGGTYDLVISSLAVEHLPAVEPLYAEARRLLRAGGFFVVVGYHPDFMLRGIPTHFDRDGESVAIVNTIHLASDHVAAARRTGFELVELHERLVDAGWVERFPSWVRHQHHPISHLWTWRCRAATTRA